MNLPKKLKEDSKFFPRHIVDENNKDVALVYNYDKCPEVKDEIIKRYNDYNLLKCYVIVLSVSVFILTIALWMK